MKIILCGYNWAGCEALRQLVEDGHRVHVFTHANPYHVPSLVEYCRKLDVPCSQQDISHSRLPFTPDIVASIYYRNIVRPWVIEAVGGRIFNLHPSLLPQYRGCSSLTWAMIDGQRWAGFTYHYIDAGCDTGNIILQQRVAIHPFDTQETLYQRVAFEALGKFRLALRSVIAGDEGVPQVGAASYNRRGCPYGGEIDPDWPEEQVERFIRAMVFPPYPVATYRGKPVHTLEEYRRLRQQSEIRRTA